MRLWEPLAFIVLTLLLPVAALALRFLTPHRYAALLQPPRAAGAASDAARQGCEKFARCALLAQRVWRGTVVCLPRAWLTCLLLRLLGHPAVLRIGVRVGGSQLAAHAWSELNGLPLDDSADIANAFAPFGFDGDSP